VDGLPRPPAARANSRGHCLAGGWVTGLELKRRIGLPPFASTATCLIAYSHICAVAVFRSRWRRSTQAAQRAALQHLTESRSGPRSAAAALGGRNRPSTMGCCGKDDAHEREVRGSSDQRAGQSAGGPYVAIIASRMPLRTSGPRGGAPMPRCAVPARLRRLLGRHVRGGGARVPGGCVGARGRAGGGGHGTAAACDRRCARACRRAQGMSTPSCRQLRSTHAIHPSA
jgi:hypothetical protein